MRYPKVVVIGGGSGLSVVLRGLKHFPIEITAIVSVADSGGSSGILKKEFNIPAPGELRNVMIALSNVEPLIEEVFQFRFGKTSSIGAHPLGNLLITAMTEITGDVQIAIKKLRKLFNIKGKILPATLEKIELIAEKESGGFIFGESERLTRLINNILQLAKLGNQQQNVQSESVPLSVLVDIIRSKTSSIIDKNNFVQNINTKKL